MPTEAKCTFFEKKLQKLLELKIKSLPLYPLKASLAQLVEHDTLNVGVLGSSPRGSTATKAVRNDCLFLFRVKGLEPSLPPLLPFCSLFIFLMLLRFFISYTQDTILYIGIG